MKTRISKAGVVFLDAAAIVNDVSGACAGGSQGSMMRYEELMKVVSGHGSQYNSSSSGTDTAESTHSKQKRNQEQSAAQVILADPTHSDVERLVVGSTVSNAITQTVRQQNLAAIYVPITIHFSLLASVRGMAVPVTEKKKKRVDPLAALLTTEKQPLRYCMRCRCRCIRMRMRVCGVCGVCGVCIERL